MEPINYNSFGWYVVPFSVDKTCTKKWKEYLEKHYKATDAFTTNSYLFSYISKVFHGEERTVQSYNIPQELVEGVKFFVKGITVPEDVLIEEATIFMCASYVGLLVYRINYGSMDTHDIIEFSYAAKMLRLPLDRSKIRGKSLSTLTEQLLQCDLNNSETSGCLTKAFFYTSGFRSHNCILLQHVVTDAEDEEQIKKQLFLLSHGYNHSFNGHPSEEDTKETDWHYSPYPYVQWAGTQNVMANLSVLTKAGDDQSLSFLGKAFESSMSNDYYCMFLLLLVQRYTLLYWTAHVHRTGNDIKYLEYADAELTKFKMRVSYNVVSDEMTYQTIYVRARQVLNIAELTDDLSEIGSKLLEDSREQDAKRESRMSSSLTFLQFLAIGSAMLDIADFVSNYTERSLLSNILSLSICGALVAFAVYQYCKKK